MTELLAEQRAYYEARAAEYDDWWERRGRYDLGETSNAVWYAEVNRVRNLFDSLPLSGSALEPAAGTGHWTRYLAERCQRVHVVDGSPEMIRLNRHHIDGAGLMDRVTYEQADLFNWTSKERFDVIFMAFWISHIPSEMKATFLQKMAGLLSPGGRIIVLDNRETPEDTPRGVVRRNRGTLRLSDETETRRLNDGRTYRIVKKFDRPEELAEAMTQLGLSAQARVTGDEFLCAIGHKPVI